MAIGAAAGGTKESPRGSYVEPRDTTPTLAEICITKKQSANAQKLASIPEPEFRERIALLKASGISPPIFLDTGQ